MAIAHLLFRGVVIGGGGNQLGVAWEKQVLRFTQDDKFLEKLVRLAQDDKLLEKERVWRRKAGPSLRSG